MLGHTQMDAPVWVALRLCWAHVVVFAKATCGNPNARSPISCSLPAWNAAWRALTNMKTTRSSTTKQNLTRTCAISQTKKSDRQSSCPLICTVVEHGWAQKLPCWLTADHCQQAKNLDKVGRSPTCGSAWFPSCFWLCICLLPCYHVARVCPWGATVINLSSTP